jgi:methionine aminopeptidase
MEEEINNLLGTNHWVTVYPMINGSNKWVGEIYKKDKNTWNKEKRKIFNHPIKAYKWTAEYLKSLIKSFT